MIIKRYIPFILAALLQSCIYPYTPDLPEESSGRVVIEGDITIGEVCNFSARKMLPLNYSGHTGETFIDEAVFSVEHDSGLSFSATQTGAASGVSLDLSSAPEKGRYRLKVRISDSTSVSDYITPWMEPIPAPTIGELEEKAFDSNQDRVLDGLHLVFVELPKFKAKNLAEKKMQVLWLRFLTEIDRDGADEVSQDLLDNPQTGQALEIVRESAYSKEEMAAYDGFWDYVSRRKGELAELERTAKELERASKELERAAGAVRARDAALAERDAEKARADAATAKLDAATAERDAAIEKMRQDKLDTARNLKAMNLSVEQIATATGLTADEITAL